MHSHDVDSPSSPKRAATRQAQPKPKTIAQSAFRSGSPSTPGSNGAGRAASSSSQSSPQTPSNRTHSKNKASNLSIRPSRRETFLDDITPVDKQTSAAGADGSSDDRDPHDLAFNPAAATRTSIMDHMLLSFDQFNAPGHSLFDEPQINSFAYDSDPYVPTSRYSAASRAHHQRGGTYGSSFSSDLDFDIADAPGRSPNHGSRGRRSNSSSNFQPMRRLESLRQESDRGRAMDSQRAGYGLGHGRSEKKGSKSSGGSLDLSQMLAGSRLPGRERRSSSIDNNGKYPHQSLEVSSGFPAAAPLSPMFEGNFPQYDGADAAPQPTIPAGPRRAHSPSSTRAVHDQALIDPNEPVPTLTRRGSAKSRHSTKSTKASSKSLGTGTLKKGNIDQNRELPPLPPLDPRAGTTSQQTSQPRSQMPASTSASEITSTAKERPGFFRKIFGSSRNAPVLTQEQIAEMGLSSSQSAGDMRVPSTSTGTEQNHNSLRAKPQREPSRDAVPQTAPSTGKEPPQTISKKPSSFFRRRKKSVSEAPPPPLPTTPIHTARTTTIQNYEPSPGGSFSKGFESYLSAVRSPSRQQGHAESPAQVSTPQSTAAIEIERPALKTTHDDSFLADSSGNEDGEETSRPAKMKIGRPPRRHADSNASVTSNRPGSKGDSLRSAGLTIDTAKAAQLTPKVEANRGFLDSASSEEGMKAAISQPGAIPRSGSGNAAVTTRSPVDPHASESDVSRYHTANNTPIVQHSTPPFSNASMPAITIDDHNNTDDAVDTTKPTESDKALAQQIFDHDESTVTEADAAAWLGDAAVERARVRWAYMQLFDWSAVNILVALRGLCDRLVLKAESQQVDRILDAFALRWCECNPNHGFKVSGKSSKILY